MGEGIGESEMEELVKEDELVPASIVRLLTFCIEALWFMLTVKWKL